MQEQECEVRPCKRRHLTLQKHSLSGRFCELVKLLKTGRTDSQATRQSQIQEVGDVSAATEKSSETCYVIWWRAMQLKYLNKFSTIIRTIYRSAVRPVTLYTLYRGVLRLAM